METAYSQLCRTWQRLAERAGATFTEEPFIEASPEQFDYLPPQAAAILKDWYKSQASKIVKNCAALRVPYKNWLIVLKTDGDYPVAIPTYKVAVRADYVPLSSFRLLMLRGPLSGLMESPFLSFTNKFLKIETSTTARDNDPKFRSGSIDIDSDFTLFGNDAAHAVKFFSNWRVRESLLSVVDPIVLSFGVYGYVAKQINLYQSVGVLDQEDTIRTIEFFKLALDTLSSQGLIATEPSTTESTTSK